MTDFDFDPFLDWDAIDDEIAADLNKAIRNQRRAIEGFSKMKRGDKDFAKAAKVFMKSQFKVMRLFSATMDHIYTVPVMVHVAGEKRLESNPDNEDQEGIIQRCSRCGSILQFWHEGLAFLDPDEGPRELYEDDVPWYSIGDVVAKSNTNNSMQMYTITDDRPLKKHERECVSLNDLMSI